ncbi:gdp-mannose -epimerase [Nannochloropsis gaditana]|uniref:Gdp-mannose-epimerase n=1 Tax=Nannochloropsis gaditana TaxID=72520 RepID=W7TCX0_9STRA|nr:gdp-mannose -epimerase [Nannochloropsis gaditana]
MSGPAPLVTGKKVLVAGGGGFIGSHLARRLKKDGNYVVVADWKKNEFMAEPEFCDEFFLVDLRELENCIKASKGCHHVYNLAADMGGMGFIESNQSVLMWNNTMVSSNVLEAARRNGAERYFYSSTACVYNEDLQLDPSNPGLKEGDAWPAKPQEVYGLEKLYHEEMALAYSRDFPLVSRIARFHNVYGPFGTWKGGREKAPAAFCRKAVGSTEHFEVWGDGEQTRSFMYVDDCVEGVLRIMMSDTATMPLNLGTEQMGVRGRNSDNTLIREMLGWEPLISIEDGLRETYFWIKGQIEKERAAGVVFDYSSSKVVVQTTESLDALASKQEKSNSIPESDSASNGVQVA